MTTDPMTEFFGEPICIYTDEQAIEDGVLVRPRFSRSSDVQCFADQ